MKKIISEIIDEIIELFGIMVIVVFVWQLLEVIIEGNVINPNNVDTIIGIILTYSLYYNYKTWKNK